MVCVTQCGVSMSLPGRMSPKTSVHAPVSRNQPLLKKSMRWHLSAPLQVEGRPAPLSGALGLGVLHSLNGGDALV